MVIQQINEPYELKLCIAGSTPRSLLAIYNFKSLCQPGFLRTRFRQVVRKG